MARQIFQTKISRSKLTLSPFSSEQMAEMGQVVLEAKIQRIKRGINSLDQLAKPLVEQYLRRKMRMNRAPIRDWTWSGLMLGSYKVKRADENRFVLGFINDVADGRATIQRRQHEMLSDSPKDVEALHAVIRATLRQKRVVRVVKSA